MLTHNIIYKLIITVDISQFLFNMNELEVTGKGDRPDGHDDDEHRH